MFIRFVVAADSDNPWWATGVITEARLLRDEGRLEQYEVDIVNSAFEWLNANLPCPPFKSNLETDSWSSSAVAWFLPGATETISRLWDLIAILKDHGVSVQILRSENPGRIVYQDDFQIVAETPDDA